MTKAGFTLRTAMAADRSALAELICESTNAWYEQHGKPPIFTGGPATTTLFPDVYEALDPGCCVVADDGSGHLLGSCFYHPRETHVALGIMNVSSASFGLGVARALLTHITGYADARGLPVRLVSSAQNLDSFSLYTRAGFVPRCTYQDLYFAVPASGLSFTTPGVERVRAARHDDVDAIVALEAAIAGIRRPQDYHYFIDNPDGIWGLDVYVASDGAISGVLGSVSHPGSTMVGPGVARDATVAAALLHHRLDAMRGQRPVFLLPCDAGELVRTVYGWGARNCELHLLQVRGEAQPLRGITMPTFMPETG